MKEDFLKKIAKWYIFLILLLIYLIFPRFTFRTLPITADKFLEMKFHYTPDTAKKILETYPTKTKLKYVFTALTADYIYPVVYFLMFSILIYWIYRGAGVSYKRIKILIYLPFLQMIFDFTENISISAGIITLYTKPEPFLMIASVATSLKWFFFALTVLSIVIGVFILIIRKLGYKKNYSEDSTSS